MNFSDAQNRLDKGKCEILREYNYAVDKYNEVYNYSLQSTLDDECIKKLVVVGESLYEVYEKAMKYVVFKYYYEEVLEGRMNFTDFENDIAQPLDTGRNSSVIGSVINIKTLCKWMAYYANPQLQVWDGGRVIQSRLQTPPAVIPSTEIDTIILQNHAGVAHNDNKHKFYYVADTQLMSICTQIFPHIENLVRRYIITSDSKVKSYGMKVNSGIHQIDKQFNGWNIHSHYKYVLVIDKTELTQEEKKVLASLPWAMIIDFDAYSNQDGLLHEYVQQKKKTPIILTPLALKKFDFSVIDTCWIFPNGREEEPQYKVQNENQWRRSARKNLQNLIYQYHTKVRAPLKILVLDKENAKRVGEILLDFFDEYQEDSQNRNIDIISLSNDVLHEANNFVTVMGENIYSYYDVNVADLVSYINVNIMPNIEDEEVERKVPIRGNLRSVDTSKYSTFTVIDIGIAKRESLCFEKIDKMKFYLGETHISWYGIQHQFPVEWTEYYSVLHNDEDSLGMVKSPLKVILHEPGAGGTTFLRMYAYERSKKQPTIFLNQYSLSQMADEIADFYIACGKTPICICADSSDLTYEQCQELKDAIDALSLAHDFIYAHRVGIACDSFCTIAELRGDTLKRMKKQLFEVMDEMNDDEIERPKEKRKEDITYITLSTERVNERMPLIMSMYAFDDRYMGTKEYIHNFITCLNKQQQQQLLYAAITDIYAGELLEITFFSEKQESIDKYGVQQYSLFQGINGKIVTQKLFTFEEKEHGVFTKIKHPQFSKVIINELLSCQDNKTAFYQKLVISLCEMISFCARPETKKSDKTSELLATLFVTKRQEALVETGEKRFFGPVIDKLYSEIDDNVLKVTLIGKIFKQLTEEYPDNPHFQAHYGRYFGIIARDYIEGIKHAKKAVEMDNHKDEILYHILATSIRRYIRDLINSYAKADDSQKEQTEELILQLAEEASQYYEISRRNKNYAGYISDIEMCIMIVDFAANGNYKQVIKSSGNKYHKYYERALSLYRIIVSNEVMLISNGDISNRISNLGNSIKLLLADLEETIEYWDYQIRREYNSEKLLTNRSMFVEAVFNSSKENLTNTRISQCTEYLERNLDYKYRYSDLFYWFELITLLHQENDYEFLSEKDMKLREWIEANPDTLELYYYLFIIDSILALGNNSRYAANMKGIAAKLNSLTYLYRGNTIPRRILIGKGKSLRDVVQVKAINEEVKAQATILEGVVDSGKLMSGNPNIFCNGIPVYFNIDRQHLYRKNRPGEKVYFKMLYSLQGAMALENTVICAEGMKKDTSKNKVNEQMAGRKYPCKYLYQGKNGSIIVELEDCNNERGLIYISDFMKGDAMKKGDIRNLVIRDNSKIKFEGKKYWRMVVENKK